jgi:hypothetical protein
LAKELFGTGPSTNASPAAVPTPMHVKRTLDAALLAAKVDFLCSCYATDVLRDAAGNPCGIVMANRGGRQAVLAKTIIDATPRATVARLAGARLAPYPTGVQFFQRIVIGAVSLGHPRQPGRRRGTGGPSAGRRGFRCGMEFQGHVPVRPEPERAGSVHRGSDDSGTCKCQPRRFWECTKKVEILF